MPNEYVQEQEQPIDLRNYLRVLLKRRWTIVMVFAIIFISVAIHTYTETPIYQATTRLIIEKENPNLVSIEEVMAVDSSGSDYYQTQYEIIQSRAVAREAIKRLHLETSEEFFPKPKDDFISNTKRAIGDTLESWKSAVLSLVKTEKKTAIKEPIDQPEQENLDSGLVSSFIGRIQVSPVRNSRLVDLSVEAMDPVLAAKMANGLARAYIEQNLNMKLNAAKDGVVWLHTRINEERQKVEKAEYNLIRYKEKHDIITDFSSDTENVTAQKLAQLNARVVEAESARVEAETRYRQALSMKGSPDMLDSIPEVINNALIGEMKSMEVGLYKRMSELSEKYGQNHPQMVAIASELKTLEKRKNEEMGRVIVSLESNFLVAKAREESLKKAFAQQKQETLNLNKKAIEYSVLSREAASARDMYDLLVKRFKETTLTEEMKTGNIRVVDPAEVRRSPIKPNRKRNLLLAVILGLAAGIGLAFFLEYLDNTIKIPDDLKQHLKIAYLGPTPLIEKQDKDGDSRERSADLVCMHSPKSTASEAYRGIRTNILFSTAGTSPQVILVTSAGPREGKTMTSSNLAVTMAQSGSRVLLLDCDLRRPKIHQIFGASREVGMTNLLVGNEPFEKVVIHTEVPNLDLVPSGPLPPNPSEMLGSKRMKELLASLRKDYDRVIIDSPPITAVTDANVLGQLVDGVILVIRAGQTVRELGKNAISQLQGVGAHILGAVLNAVDIGKDKYYYYYYYQYYHYYYGDDGEKKKRRNKKRKKSKSKGAYYGEDDKA